MTVDDAPWGRKISLTDLDHNRLRVAEPVPPVDADDQLGLGGVARLTALEHAMWDSSTRGDRSWMEAHLTDDFTEFGYAALVSRRLITLRRHLRTGP